MECNKDITNHSIGNHSITLVTPSIVGHRANIPRLTFQQTKILLTIFHNHSLVSRRFFLEEMSSVYQTLSNLGNPVTTKQKIKEYCFAETTFHQLIGHPSVFPRQCSKFPTLPKKLSVYIENLTEDQADDLFTHLTHKQTRELVSSDLEKILLNAVEEHNHLFIQFLCAAGASCPALTHTFNNIEIGERIFLQTAKERNLGALEVFFHAADEEVKPCLLRAYDRINCTAFMYAVRIPGAFETMKEWLTELNSSDLIDLLRRCDEFGRTALWHAAPHIDVFIALLRVGADPTVQDKEGRTQLMDAILSENVYMVETLLKATQSNHISFLRKKDAEGMTALMHAARNPDVYFLNTLLACCQTPEDRSLLVKDCDPLGRTALMFAALCNPAGVASLLKAHADPADRDSENKTALMYASRPVGNFKSLQVIPLLLGRNNSITLKLRLKDQGRKCLQEAIENENLDFVKSLLAAAFDVPGMVGILLEERDENDRTVLMHAQQKDNEHKKHNENNEHTEDILKFLKYLLKGYVASRNSLVVL